MTLVNVQLIETGLRQEWSSVQVSGWLEEEHGITISLETIYLFVRADKYQRDGLYTHLRRQIKGYRSRKGPYYSRGKIKNRVSIHDRPAAVDAKERIALLAPYRDVVLTITADKVKAFAYHEQVVEVLNAQVYFADPYSSWQRGLNENTKSLPRVALWVWFTAPILAQEDRLQTSGE